MKKFFWTFFITVSFLKGDSVSINNFKSDLFSRDKNTLKKVEASLLFEGRYLKENRYKVIDGLNIIISSFYVEDLFTSRGKEKFKNLLKKYLSKKYSVDIDHIYIQKLDMIDNVNIDEFIQALKAEGFCKERKSSIKKSFDELNLH